jgi:hypothetical protein
LTSGGPLQPLRGRQRAFAPAKSSAIARQLPISSASSRIFRYKKVVRSMFQQEQRGILRYGIVDIMEAPVQTRT